MKKHGFTLIELTVVISIIAFLMAVSVSVFSSVRQQARNAVCQHNIKQIALAFTMYHDTHHTFPSAFVRDFSMPDSVKNISDHSTDWLGLWWFYYLELTPDSASLEKTVLQCPSKNHADPKYKYNVLWGNYGVNWSVCKSPSGPVVSNEYPEFMGSPAKLPSISDPSGTLLLADSGYAIITWVHTLPGSHERAPNSSFDAFNQAYLPGASVNKQKDLWAELTEDAKGRHSGKAVNCLYTDGHTEKKKADELVVEPLNHGQYGNITPLWRPK